MHPLDSDIYQRTIRKISKLVDLMIEELEHRQRERKKKEDKHENKS